MTDVTPAPGPCRPRWTLAYKIAGVDHERDYDVPTEAEARSRLSFESPAAYDITATYCEVPL